MRMVVEKKKKTIFHRLTNKFIHPQRSSKRDQSVQTGHQPSIAMTILVNSDSKQCTTSSENQSTHVSTSMRRRRSSLKTFLMFQSPKPMSMIHRSRRCSINLKAPKRLSSECLQVALIRKIQPVNHYDSSAVLSSTASHYSCKQILNDEISSHDEFLSIGPMKWSTPNRTVTYQTSSPYNNHFGQRRRLCLVDQLSFSDIFDRSD